MTFARVCSSSRAQAQLEIILRATVPGFWHTVASLFSPRAPPPQDVRLFSHNPLLVVYVCEK